MAQIIYLRIGEKDRVPFDLFISSLQDFLGILRDFDATISKNRGGSVKWEVVSVRQDSPPQIGVSPIARPNVQDFSQVVEHQVMENASLLATTSEPNQYMSFSALQRIERMAFRTKVLGRYVIYASNGAPKRESDITERTLENVQKITGIKYVGYGSVIGSLDGIYVHKADEFRVWDEQSGRPVRCKFKRDDESRIKDLLRHRVLAYGTVSSNRMGIPISMDVDRVEDHQKKQLPTIEEMSGSIKGITEGKPLKEYLAKIDDE